MTAYGIRRCRPGTFPTGKSGSRGVRHLPPTAAPGSGNETTAPIAADARYVGSAACESCHKEIFTRWRRTRMANVVRDPREHPDAFIPDFSQPNRF
jgi:hypothetical protein